MSLLQFLRILLARWKMILSTALACFVVATAIAMIIPKQYPATARVLLDIKADPVTGEAVGGRNDRGYLGTQLQIIRDMRVAGAVVDRLGLGNEPGTVAAYEASGRSAADGGIRAWLGQQIIDNTQAQMVPGSNILEIRYNANNPERAKAIVSVIRDAYIDESLRLRTDSASRTGAWFREQTEKSREALAAAEQELSAFMVKNNIILVGGVDSESAKLTALQAALQQAQGMQSATDASVSVRLANDPVSDQLQVQLATIEDELALAAAKLGPEHPSYKAILARRNTLQRQIAIARSNSAAGVSAQAGAVRTSIADLERQVAAQSRLVLDRKPILDELVRLSREVDLKRQQYEAAFARTDQLRQQADQSEAGLVVMGDPQASNSPSYPKVGLIMALSVVFGLGLGVLAALIAEFIARRVRGYEDLSYAAGAPVLVTVAAAAPSPIKLRIQKLLGRRYRTNDAEDLQAI